MEMSLINNLENNLTRDNSIKIAQNNFLQTNLGQGLNNAFDFGLRVVLPDLIEEDVIDIKNAFLNEGLKEGVQTAVDKAITLGKNIVGIFTGNFENITDIKEAVKKGGLIDNFSKLLDGILDTIKNKEILSSEVVNTIKTGKNAILNIANDNIEKSFKDQMNSLTKLEKYLNNWNKEYEKKDFNGMDREYKKIRQEMKNIVPIENVITKMREVENLHNLIKNNGKNFNISEYEKELANKLA